MQRLHIENAGRVGGGAMGRARFVVKVNYDCHRGELQRSRAALKPVRDVEVSSKSEV
jgi:hypothetical protein